tara:strand:+ start:984 stop:1517 length:534 start_codon:yes stop_codon:yes gene_type:complete
MDNILERFETLGQELLNDLENIEDKLFFYEQKMEFEDIDIINDLQNFFCEGDSYLVNTTNDMYSAYLNDLHQILQQINIVGGNLLDNVIVQELQIIEVWMDLVLEYPERDIDNIMIEVERAVDIIQRCLRFIRSERQRILIESQKRVEISKLLSERLGPNFAQTMDPRMLESIIERI